MRDETTEKDDSPLVVSLRFLDLIHRDSGFHVITSHTASTTDLANTESTIQLRSCNNTPHHTTPQPRVNRVLRSYYFTHTEESGRTDIAIRPRRRLFQFRRHLTSLQCQSHTTQHTID